MKLTLMAFVLTLGVAHAQGMMSQGNVMQPNFNQTPGNPPGVATPPNNTTRDPSSINQRPRAGTGSRNVTPGETLPNPNSNLNNSNMNDQAPGQNLPGQTLPGTTAPMNQGTRTPLNP